MQNKKKSIQPVKNCGIVKKIGKKWYKTVKKDQNVQFLTNSTPKNAQKVPGFCMEAAFINVSPYANF